MRMKEDKGRERFEAALRQRYGSRVQVEKLHGSLFQSGLPDVLLTWTNGDLVLIEYKCADVATIGQAFQLLQGRQRPVLMRLGLNDANAYLLVRSKSIYKEGSASWALIPAILLVNTEAEQMPLTWETLSDVVVTLDAHVRDNGARLRGR